MRNILYLCVMGKHDLRNAKKDEKEALRLVAIKLYKQKKSQKEISILLNIHKNTIHQWVKKYKQDGLKGLKDQKQGHDQGVGRLLSANQEKEIQNMIIDKMPEQLKLPFGLWTRKAIVELIKRQYNIKIAIRTMGTYLKRWGFSPQKPKKKAYEQNVKSVQKWLIEEYPAIVKKAKTENAEIHWGDETGIRNTSQYGRSYAPIGQTPTKTTMAKRISLNMISTVTNQGKVRFMTYSGTMNAQRFIIFLKRLIKGANKKIYLILDNLKVHHSKLVKQ
jgi:transposase